MSADVDGFPQDDCEVVGGSRVKVVRHPLMTLKGSVELHIHLICVVVAPSTFGPVVLFRGVHQGEG